jgi:hypothetical protein
MDDEGVQPTSRTLRIKVTLMMDVIIVYINNTHC